MPSRDTGKSKLKAIQPATEVNATEALVSKLGWTPEQAAQVRASLQSFDADWNAPGMEEYDRL